MYVVWILTDVSVGAIVLLGHSVLGTYVVCSITYPHFWRWIGLGHCCVVVVHVVGSIQVKRGGLITFHGPGQLVCYPVLNLRNIKVSV